jgi:hypothetical protein
VRFPLLAALLLTIGACTSTYAQESSKAGQKPCDCDSKSRGPFYCPIVDIMPTGIDTDLYECNYYPTDCTDLPEDTFYSGPYPHDLADCPNPAKCFGYSFPAAANRGAADYIPALPNKISMKNLPFRNDVEVCTDREEFLHFDRNGVDTWVCIFPLVHVDNNHENTRFFHLGLEIDPNTTSVKPNQLVNAQTVYPYLYTVVRGHEIVYVICTK